jgi:hypothetical protein
MMTRDEIIRTAKIAGAKFDNEWNLSLLDTDTVMRFAKLLMLFENEHCAQACTCHLCAEMIRARTDN